MELSSERRLSLLDGHDILYKLLALKLCFSFHTRVEFLLR